MKYTDAATTINSGALHGRDCDLTITYSNTNAVTLNGTIGKAENGGNLAIAAEADVTFNTNVKLDNDNQTVGGTVKVNNATLTLGHDSASNTTPTYNRVELNGATLHAATKGDNNVRNFTTLAVGGSSTLTQASWHTLWNIGSLNNLDAQTPDTLTWDSTTNHNKTSIMTLSAAGDFSGKLVVNRHTNNASNGSYQAYLQVNHAQALQNATVELKDTNANNNAAMALNTSAVTIAGLEGTANSIVYAGAANTAPGSTAPTSTGTSTVTIGGDLILSVDGDANTAPVAIFTDVESLTLSGVGENVAMGWYDASQVLSSLTINGGTAITGSGLENYVIGYRNGTVSVAAASVPEPATLSLLALAALAARRRSK